MRSAHLTAASLRTTIDRGNPGRSEVEQWHAASSSRVQSSAPPPSPPRSRRSWSAESCRRASCDRRGPTDTSPHGHIGLSEAFGFWQHRASARKWRNVGTTGGTPWSAGDDPRGFLPQTPVRRLRATRDTFMPQSAAPPDACATNPPVVCGQDIEKYRYVKKLRRYDSGRHPDRNVHHRGTANSQRCPLR